MNAWKNALIHPHQKEWSNFRFADHRFKDPYIAEWLNFHPVRPHVSDTRDRFFAAISNGSLGRGTA